MLKRFKYSYLLQTPLLKASPFNPKSTNKNDGYNTILEIVLQCITETFIYPSSLLLLIVRADVWKMICYFDVLKLLLSVDI